MDTHGQGHRHATIKKTRIHPRQSKTTTKKEKFEQNLHSRHPHTDTLQPQYAQQPYADAPQQPYAQQPYAQQPAYTQPNTGYIPQTIGAGSGMGGATHMVETGQKIEELGTCDDDNGVGVECHGMHACTHVRAPVSVVSTVCVTFG